MKKVFILIAFLFAVVCFAAPPPDFVPDIVTAQAEFVVQDNKTVAGYTFEAQEVTYNCIVDSYVYYGASVAAYDSPMLPDVQITKGVIMNRSNLGTNYRYSSNNQHCNYGYPFGGNYV